MAQRSEKNIAAQVFSLLKEPVCAAGFSLWDVLFYKEGGEDTLAILLDAPGGVSLTDCEAVTRLVNPILDRADPIAHSYVLEVSSAGTERTLKKAEHFAAFLGSEVCASLYTPQNGKKEVCGILRAYDAGAVTIGEVVLQKGQFAVVKTVDASTRVDVDKDGLEK